MCIPEVRHEAGRVMGSFRQICLFTLELIFCVCVCQVSTWQMPKPEDVRPAGISQQYHTSCQMWPSPFFSFLPPFHLFILPHHPSVLHLQIPIFSHYQPLFEMSLTQFLSPNFLFFQQRQTTQRIQKYPVRSSKMLFFFILLKK